MNTLKISPAAGTTTTKDSPELAVSPSSTADASWVATPPPKKTRFLRRKRASSNTVPTYTRSQSSSSSLEDSQPVPSNSSKPKKKSFLSRLLGKTTSKKSLVIETTTTQSDLPQEDKDDTAAEDDFTEIDLLEEQGQQLRLAGQTAEAFSTWEHALDLLGGDEARDGAVCKSNQLLCRMIDLHMRLAESEEEHDESDQHLDQADALIAQLQPLQTNDNSAHCLEASPLLMDMLTSHSAWTYALQVSHQMPETDAMTLARLHLEVARDQSDRPLSHLSDCHQLLLTCNGGADHLWQELAQMYGNLGEEELALGCSQSRMAHLVSPEQIALAHYDQALNVYGPVGQYGLALKEAELALNALTTDAYKANENPVEVNNDEDADEGELLLVKLYQFKADVLCRMGRIDDSIQSYEQLLQAYKESTNFGPIDSANVLYILGKLCVRSKQFHQAIEYFDRELQMTKSVVGPYHLAISKIHHEQAKVADAGLMDYALAIRYYEDALKVESGVYRHAKAQEQEKGSTLLDDARSQLSETKQRLGKLHFKMGDFSMAMRTTLSVEK